MKKIDGIAIRNAGRSLRNAVDRQSQPRMGIASGYVSSVNTDSAGKITGVQVRTTDGSTVSASVPFGANVYTGMTVSLRNFGSPSLASWEVAGTSALPAGTSGGVIYNQNGNAIAMFDNIWVHDDGFIRAGGSEDPDGNPTGPRGEMTQDGLFGWDAYDNESLKIFFRNVERNGVDRFAGDIIAGYDDGSRIELSVQDRSFGIWNGEEASMLFSPTLGNRITNMLWVGDEAGPQVGIGKSGDDAVIVARNQGSGSMTEIGNQVLFMVSSKPDHVTVHMGDPDRSENYLFYDSSDEGLLTVDAHIRARSMTVYGGSILAEDGYIAATDNDTLAGIWLRDRYLEGRGTSGDRTFLLTAATVQLDRHPYDPSYGSILWNGGSAYVGDILHLHFRYQRLGPNSVLGFYNGEDPKVYFDAGGNAVLDGTLYAWSGEVVVGREGHGIEIPVLPGGLDEVQKLVSFVKDTTSWQFAAGLWSASDATESEATETSVNRINISLGTWYESWMAGFRSLVRTLSYSAPGREAKLRLQAVGDGGSANQAIIDLFSYGGDDGAYSRIDLNANVVQMSQTTTAPAATTGFALNDGQLSFPDGTSWDPFPHISGQYLVARLSATWVPFAQARGTDWRWGGDQASSYTQISGSTGDMTFAGSARIAPRLRNYTKTADFIADQTEATTYRCNPTTGAANMTATLPAASSSNTGIWFSFRKIDSSDTYTVTVSGVSDGDVVLRSPRDCVIVESTGTLWEIVSAPARGYALNLMALNSNVVDAQTIYFGNRPAAPSTTAASSRIYIPKSGTLKVAEIFCYAATVAGSNENWTAYVRLNNTTDYTVATVAAATNNRRWSNTGMSVAVKAGDYIEIKLVNPTWATNPTGCTFSGSIYIE